MYDPQMTQSSGASPGPPWQAPGGGTFRPYEVVLGLMPLMLAINILVSLVYLPMALNGFADFRQLYTGGYMIRTGMGDQLYNYETQQRTEESLVPMPGGLHFLLPITHLAFEELLFAPLSMCSYRIAFCIFLVINLILTGICILLLYEIGEPLRDRWKWFVPFLVAGFFPVWRALLQGQDSILLLFLLMASFCLLHRGQLLAAGVVMGVALFKFNIVIPLALLFLLSKRWAFFAGFMISSIAALGASFLIVGLRGFHDYVGTISAMSVHLGSSENVIRYATISTEMVNLRGLISALLQGHVTDEWVQKTIFIASAAVLLSPIRKRPSFGLAVCAGSLVSYNFVAHDAAILIIPVVGVLASRQTFPAVFAIATWIAPFAAIIPRYGFIGSIPVLGLFLMYVSGNKSMQEEFTRVFGGV